MADQVERTEHGLRVRRDGDPSGWWIWRRASYVVYETNKDGEEVVVLRGDYRNHADALRAARRLSQTTRPGSTT